EFYQHYTNHNLPEKAIILIPRDLTPSRNMEVYKEIWPLGISAMGVFLITLAVFPVVCVKIDSMSLDKEWANVYFQPVATFFLFSVGDYMGRQSSGFILWPKRGSRILYLMVLLRLVFIPLFLLCNHDPKSFLPVVFYHDAYYIVFMFLFAFSNGYCSSLYMMYGPKMVTEDRAELAGAMMVAMLGLGLMLGGISSFAFALIE
ncbi:hypothetical protein SK128_000996, partial [Halocaridina rubra]